MGGTFNPIHLGHLHVAEEARHRANLDRILFIPNQVAPHRRDQEDMAPALDRYVMTCMAVGGNPHFRCSPLELHRSTVSYTHDTVTQLVQEHPDWELTFLTGADSLVRSEWYRLDDLLGFLHSFRVIARPGFPREALEAHLDRLGLANRERISWLEIPGFDVSATDIRARIRQGRAWRYLVPAAVHDYIETNRLYLPPAGARPG